MPEAKKKRIELMGMASAQFFRATFLAALFTILNRATRSKADSGLKALLGCLLAVLFLVPLNIPIIRMEITASTESSFVAEKEQETEVSPAPPAEVNPGGEQPGEANANKNFFSVEAAVWAIYTLGVSITLFCTFYGHHKAAKALLRCGRAPSADENEIYLRLCRKHGLRKAPLLLVCSSSVIGSSLTFGVFRQTIIISEKFPQADYAMILEHELMHCKRKDSLTKVLLALVNAFYWFNPIMYMFVCEMNALCEESCDEMLLKNSSFEQKEAYCLLLIKNALSKSAEKKSMFSAFKGGKIMKQRITNIISKKSKLITALFLVTVVLIATLTSAAYVTTPPENIKVAHFTKPEQVCEALNPDDIISDYYNIDYSYSVDSDKVKVSGTVMGKPFDITATFASPSYNGARMVYTAEDNKGNYFVQAVKIEFAQSTEAANLPIQDHNVGEYARHEFGGFFKDYAKANPQYKNALEVYLTPIDENGNVTDEIILIEIFIEEDFITDYIKTNNSKCVDELAASEIERWYSRWYTKYNLWNYKPAEK